MTSSSDGTLLRLTVLIGDAAELWGTGVAVLDEVTLVAPRGGDHSG